MASETTTAFHYVEAAYGGAENRNKVLTLAEFEQNGYADCYRSMFRYPKTFAAYVEYKGSVKGYDGEAKADFFAADFDDAADFARALEDARQNARRWEALYGAPTEALRYYFSGSKGVHIEIPEALFGELEPGRNTARRLRAVAGELLKESATADYNIYETLRLWREPGTKHRKSGLYKIPLYPHEFFNLAAGAIRELAKEKREKFVAADPGEFEPVPELVRLWQHSQDSSSEDVCGERLDTEKVLNGVPQGERDTRLFKLACRFRGAGIPQDAAERLLVEAACKCEPPFPMREALQKVENAYSSYPAGGGACTHTRTDPIEGYVCVCENEVRQSGLRIKRLRDIPDPGPRVFHIERLVPKGHPTSIYGAGGSTKSLLTLSMLQAIAREDVTAWLGQEIGEHCPCLFVDFELEEGEQRRRSYAIAVGGGYETPPDELHYLCAAGYPTDTVLRYVLKECKGLGIGVVAIDSVGLVMDGDAGRSRDVIDFFKRLDAFRMAGITTILVDHQGKTQAGESYQSKTAYGAAYKGNLSRSRVQVEVRDKGDGVRGLVLRHNKANFGDYEKPFAVKAKFTESAVTLERESLAAAELSQERVLNTTDRILLALRDGSAYIRDFYSEPEWGVAIATVRNAANKLKNDGYVSETGAQEGKQRELALTGRGKEYVKDYLAQSAPLKQSGTHTRTFPIGESACVSTDAPLSAGLEQGESAALAELRERRRHEDEEAQTHPLDCPCLECSSPAPGMASAWEGSL